MVVVVIDADDGAACGAWVREALGSRTGIASDAIPVVVLAAEVMTHESFASSFDDMALPLPRVPVTARGLEKPEPRELSGRPLARPRRLDTPSFARPPPEQGFHRLSAARPASSSGLAFLTVPLSRSHAEASSLNASACVANCSLREGSIVEGTHEGSIFRSRLKSSTIVAVCRMR